MTDKYLLVAAIHYLLFKINLSLATGRNELTDDESELVDLLSRAERRPQ